MVTYADVELVGSPSNPPDGEHVVSVEELPIEEAVERLRVANTFEAELLGFVTDMRGRKRRRLG